MGNSRFKFRAWDVIEGKMIEWKRLVDFCDISFLFEYQSTGGIYQNIPMQYTGLKDKNGVEIYEGDICKVVGSGNLQAVIDPLHGLCFGDYTVTYHDCMMENDEIAVIGNIYENPELLGEKQ